MEKQLGHNLSFSHLRDYLDCLPEEVKVCEIQALVPLLGNPKIIQKRKWNDLSRQFFDHYQYDILPSDWQIKTVQSQEFDILIDFFSGMKRENDLKGYSYEKLARLLVHSFCPEDEESSVCTKLKKTDGYLFNFMRKEYYRISNLNEQK